MFCVVQEERMVVNLKQWNIWKVLIISDLLLLLNRNQNIYVSLLVSKSCTHPDCITQRFLEGPNRTFENIRDNLYSTMTLARICRKLGLHFTYVGTGYLFAYDQDHSIGGNGFADDGIIIKFVFRLVLR